MCISSRGNSSRFGSSIQANAGLGQFKQKSLFGALLNRAIDSDGRTVLATGSRATFSSGFL
ncbi:hypothetical protein RLEG3_23185 [Rhizobium leguminosarum bv. trifolii WSM1689]|nr:hypothetical protein RLEG3_23185 [Rhizobium leguminosarum bv. trifolii WSM1689]